MNACVPVSTSLYLSVSPAGEATEAPSPAVSVGPYFLSPGSRNITATVGQTAYLPCRVAELADQAVSLRGGGGGRGEDGRLQEMRGGKLCYDR